MAIIFNQAPIVTASNAIRSSDMIGLADAFNSRILSGLGDCSKRIHQYVFNNFRQFRNPAEDGLTFPSLGEFSMFYQMVDPDIATYPIARAGDYEGINVSSPSGQFVFGIAGATEDEGTEGEGSYIESQASGILTAGSSIDPEGYWELAKSQRGGYDNLSGGQYAPMLDVAQRHFRLAFPDWIRHHKGPGGYLPSPLQLVDSPCRQIDANGNTHLWANYSHTWQSLSDPQDTVTFGGTCGPNAGGSDSDVAYIRDYPFAWYVYQFNGTVTRINKSEYVKRNTGGGYPTREDGGQITRLMINPFVAEFRGTEQQRMITCFDSPYIKYSFGNQDFFTSQYQLAPASGSLVGDTVVTNYPSWTISTTQVSGSTTATVNLGYGYRVGGHLIKQRYLQQSASIQLLSGSTVIDTFTIYPQSGSQVNIFHNGPTGNGIGYRFLSSASFSDPSGYIYIEQSHLWDSKPEIWDAYALIRLSTSKGTTNELDTVGVDHDQSREISDVYFRYGCLINQFGAGTVHQQTTEINTNPVFDAARRYVNSFTRTINASDMQLTSRPLLVGYEVSGGKSILYFERYQSAVGLLTQNIDLFDGLLNTENSASNGIIATAPTTGYTNEWVLELCSKPYHSSESSIWKESVYANYYPYINRCHILPDSNREINSTHKNQKLFPFFQDVRPDMLSDARNRLYYPESLTAYNYDGNPPINKPTYNVVGDTDYDNAVKFYKSCQVYPKPHYIESVQAIANNRVKITLSTRLQHTSVAPSTIANNVAAWTYADVRDEPYRTDENAVRLFLLNRYNSSNNPPATIGDQSYYSEGFGMTDNPYASIIPTFFLTKLIPKPWIADGIETTGSVDVSGSLPRAYDGQLCETYLRAICEGFVDERTSISNACNEDFQVDYDYTFSNLCYDAFSGSWINNVSSTIRSDNPMTYGPLPDQVLCAETFNQLSKAVNKLTRVRLPLPWRLEGRYKIYQGSTDITQDYPSGDGSCTSNNNSKGVEYNFSPSSATTLVTTTDWIDVGDSFNVSSYVTYDCGVDNKWTITTVKQVGETRLTVTDDIAWYACNDDLRGLASGSTSTGGVFAQVEEVNQTYDITEGPEPNNVSCGKVSEFWKNNDTGLYFQFNQITTTDSSCRYIASSTNIEAGALQQSDIAIGFGINAEGNINVCFPAGPSSYSNIYINNKQHIIISVPTV